MRLRAAWERGYRRLVGWQEFRRALIAVFVADAVAALALAITDAANIGRDVVRLDTRSYVTLGNLAASALTAAMILVGVARLRRSQRSAYYSFKHAMPVAIFVVQPYRFFTDQLGALGGLLVDFVPLIKVNYLLTKERTAQQAALHTPHGADAGRTSSERRL